MAKAVSQSLNISVAQQAVATVSPAKLTFDTFNVGVNANNELVFDAALLGQALKQTLPCTAPCVIVLDTATNNFVALPIADWQPGYTLVSTVTSIS